MKFDLNTAFAVREREDGLLEKDTFDLSTAVPVEGDISLANKVMSNPNVSKMIDTITGGLSIEEGNKVLTDIVEPLASIGEILTEDKSFLPTPSKVGKATVKLAQFVLNAIARPVTGAQEAIGAVIDKKPAQEIAQSFFKGYLKPEEVETLTSRIPFQEWEQGAWFTLIPRATTEAIETYLISTLVYGNIAGKIKKAYQEQKVAGALKEFDDITTKMAKDIVKEPEKFKINFPKEWNEADKLGMTKAYIQNRLGSVPKVGEVLLERQSFMNKLKATLLSERGSLQIPKVGSTVNWKGQVGTIKEITGERVIIQLGKSEVVASLSQLSLPKVEQPTEGKVYYTGGKEIITDFTRKKTLRTGEEKLGTHFTTSEDYAKTFAGKEGKITQVSLNIKKPYNITKENELLIEAPYSHTSFIKELKDKGYDAIVLKGQERAFGKGKHDQVFVLDPSIIKLPTPTGEGQKPPVEPPKTAVSGEPEPEEPIKINNLNISPEAKAKLDATIEEIRPELEKIKGETLTHDEILEAAKTSEILTSATSREATKNFEAKLLRTRQHLAALSEQKGVSAEFIETLKAIRSAGTDLARGLGSLRIEAMGEEYTLKTKIVNDIIDAGVELDKIIKTAEGIDFKNQEQVTKFYRQFVKPKLWDIINEYRYINLLSSPKTHIVNAFSNMIQVAGLAPGTKLFMGDIKGVATFYKGAWGAIGEATTKALDALKGKTFVERPDVKHIPTGVKALRPLRYIPQALEAMDVFFRTIAYEGELASQLEKKVEPKLAEKLSKEKASYYVFRKALDPNNKTEQGHLLSAIDNLTSLAYKARSIPIIGRLVSWYIPFVQTPMNIAKQMIEYSPAGFTTIPGAGNKKEQLAKTLLGSLIFGLAAYLVYKNESTWATPTNKKERDLFFAAKRQPFSIKIGNTWIGYSRLGPVALPIAIPAAIKYYTTQNPNSATDNNLQKTTKVIGGLGEFFASMSYVEGIGQLLQLVKNAPGAGARLVTQAPSQLILLSSLQRWINNFVIDPIYRKTDKDFSVESIISEARKSIIFGTKGLPAYTDPEGEESRRSYPGLNAFSPLPISKSNREYEEEYKQYIEERKETLIEKKESGGEPTRTRRRRR